MYADDTTLFCNINNDINDNEINRQLNTINEWLLSNKLSLNIKKTKYMVFHTNQRRVLYPNLYLNMMKIERVTQFNFLCIVLSSNLKWNKHTVLHGDKFVLVDTSHQYLQSIEFSESSRYVYMCCLKLLLQTYE